MAMRLCWSVVLAATAVAFQLKQEQKEPKNSCGVHANPHGTRDIGIGDHGYWETKNAEKSHKTDSRLARAVSDFVKAEGAKSIIDLGCGSPCNYVKLYNKAGISAYGVDGDEQTGKFGGNCGVADLTGDIMATTTSSGKKHGSFDWAISLEVWEHIPEQYESKFANNLFQASTDGVIVSVAALGQGGQGHVNCRPQSYVKEKFTKAGFTFDEAATKKLQNAATLDWLKRNILVFRKNKV